MLPCHPHPTKSYEELRQKPPLSQAEGLRQRNSQLGAMVLFMKEDRLKYQTLQLQDIHDVLALLNELKSEHGEGDHLFTLNQLHAYANISYSKRRKFKTFRIPKKSGGVRTISAPVNSHYLYLLRYINQMLQSVYSAPRCATGFIRNKSVVTNAKFHVGKSYVYNTDLKDFFLRISRKQVYEALQEPLFNWPFNVAYLIASICCMNSETEKVSSPEKYCLPQGAPTSPIITNIVCLDLDREITEISQKRDIIYSRYADDMTFSCDRDAFGVNSRFIRDLKHILYTHKLKQNTRKTRLQHRGVRQEVTGLNVTEKVNVQRSYIRNLRNLFYIWENYGKEAAEKSFAAVYNRTHKDIKRTPNIVNVVYGKLMYLKMVKGANDPLYTKLVNKFTALSHVRIMDKPKVDIPNIRSWEECLKEWEENKLDYRVKNMFGIHLTIDEYNIFKKEKRNIEQIHGWCNSGNYIHEMERLCSHLPTKDNPSGVGNNIGLKTPRKGFYRIINVLDDNERTLVCYYNYHDPNEFVEENVEISSRPLYNKVSIGPKDHMLRVGDILHVKEDVQLVESKYNGELYTAYKIVWDYDNL